jgi:hypothetical protein
MKSDIQATTITAADTTVAVITPSIRLRAIIVTSNSSTATGQIILNNGTATGFKQFDAKITPNQVLTLNLPLDGIIFPNGIFVSTVTNVASAVLITDKYNAPGPSYQPQP